MKSKTVENGFTLVELLVVIAIIGILSSVVFGSFSSARMRARDTKRISDIYQIRLALEMYAEANGNKYPTAISSANLGTYLSPVPTDNGTAYKYAYYPATSPTSYHLGAILEQTGNDVLSNDSNCNSSTATSNNCPQAAQYFNPGGSAGGFNGASVSCDTSANATPLSNSKCFDLAR